LCIFVIIVFIQRFLKFFILGVNVFSIHDLCHGMGPPTAGRPATGFLIFLI